MFNHLADTTLIDSDLNDGALQRLGQLYGYEISMFSTDNHANQAADMVLIANLKRHLENLRRLSPDN